MGSLPNKDKDEHKTTWIYGTRRVPLKRRINLFIFFFSSVATFFTVLYSLRLVYVIFFMGRHRAPARNILEPGGYLAAGINILVVPAIIGGLGISWATRSYRHLIFLPI